MWILVLKGLKQAIEAHTATAIILVWVSWIAKNYSQPNFPHPTLDGILVHHSIAPNGM